MRAASAGTVVNVSDETALHNELEGKGTPNSTVNVTTNIPTTSVITTNPGPTGFGSNILQGNGPGTSKITGSGSHAIINNGTGTIGLIRNIEIANGNYTGSGDGAGGVTGWNMYSGELNNVSFQGNRSSSTKGGGALGYYAGSSLGVDIIGGTKFNDNHATVGSGGAIYIEGFYSGSKIGESGSKVSFTENTADKNGGAIYIAQDFGPSNVNSSLTNVNFEHNIAKNGSGGALYVGKSFGGYTDYTGTPSGLPHDMINNVFKNNEANNGGSGGAVFINEHLMGNITGNTFTGNKANVDGGGLNVGTEIKGDITGNTFDSNNATKNGGAINANKITLSSKALSGNNFNGNIAGVDGGAINVGTLTGTVSDTFTGNTATGGNGGALNVQTFTGKVSASTFTGNKANNGKGGAIYGDLSTVENSTFANNTAKDGGAIYTSKNTNATITNTKFTNNQALGGGKGGAFYASKGANFTFNNTEFTGNKAETGDGGGAYFDMATGTDNYNVVLSADKDKVTSFKGNTDKTGKNSFVVGGAGSSATFNMQIKGEGTVDLTDPFRVDIADSNFSLTQDSLNSTLLLSGKSTINTNTGKVNLDFNRGLTRLTEDNGNFHIEVTGKTDTNLHWGTGNTLRIDDLSARDPNLPLVKMSDQGDNTFKVSPGATLDVSRMLKPTNQPYLLVDNVNKGGITASKLNYLHPDGFIEMPMIKGTADGLRDQYWLDTTKLPDAFDPNTASANVANAENGMTQWLNNTDPGATLTSNQVVQLRRDFNSGPPEAILDMALVGMDTHGTALNAARQGFHARGSNMMRNRGMMSGRYPGSTYADGMPADGMSEDCPPIDCPPMDCLPTSGFSIWASYVGALDDARSTREHSGYETTTHGGMVGAVWQASPAFALGAYFGYSRSSVDFKDITAEGNADGIHTGLQASIQTPMGLRLTVDGSYSHNSVDVERDPGQLGFGKDASSFNQKVYGAGVEVAWPFFVTERTVITPAASFDATWMRQNEVREHGPIMAAIVDKLHEHRLVSRVGATIEHDFAIGHHGIITPSFGANWKHRFSGRDVKSQYHFIDNLNDPDYNGVKDSLRSRKMGANSLELAAFVDANLWAGASSQWSLRAGYTVDISDHQTGHTFYGGVGVSF